MKILLKKTTNPLLLENFADCKHPFMIIFSYYNHFCFELVLNMEAVFVVEQIKQGKQ